MKQNIPPIGNSGHSVFIIDRLNFLYIGSKIYCRGDHRMQRIWAWLGVLGVSMFCGIILVAVALGAIIPRVINPIAKPLVCSNGNLEITQNTTSYRPVNQTRGRQTPVSIRPQASIRMYLFKRRSARVSSTALSSLPSLSFGAYFPKLLPEKVKCRISRRLNRP